MARLFLGVTQGFIGDDATAEDFAAHLDQIMDTEGYFIPSDRADEFATYLPKLGFEFEAGTRLTGRGDD